MEGTFKTTAHGKWILAGEHAVLRGCSALVFPVIGKGMSLQYTKTESDLVLNVYCELGQDLQQTVENVITRAFEKCGISREAIKGELKIHNNLLLGGGLGASASLCVIISRWVATLGLKKESEVYELARQLEDIFHGQSSGADIAVALGGRGLYFEPNGVRRPLEIFWKPKWFLSYCGENGSTADCVAKVQGLEKEQAGFLSSVDDQMKEAVRLCERSLAEKQAKLGVPILKQGIDLAADCFKKWGLISEKLQKHIAFLQNNGAVAVKPTGSGGGGFVLSLWDQEPPESVKKILIPC